MAKEKWYAVRNGRIPGIYTTWADCEAQVKGYGGAIYKSFLTEEEAKAFLGGDSSVCQSARMTVSVATKKAEKMPEKKPPKVWHEGLSYAAYVDGSYDSQNGIVGYGGVLLVDGEEAHRFSFGTKEEKYQSIWNVAGEVLASTYVISYAIEQGWPEITIFYDYRGIEMWGTGAWKANTEVTKAYVNFVKDAKRDIKVHFQKVPAHSGVYYNEVADQLAKDGTKQ